MKFYYPKISFEFVEWERSEKSQWEEKPSWKVYVKSLGKLIEYGRKRNEKGLWWKIPVSYLMIAIFILPTEKFFYWVAKK
jgi:hypothetical protein